MVIQRWQSLLLFLAFVCTVVYVFLPFGSVVGAEGAVEPATVMGCPALLVLVIATALLQLISIFMFKSLKLQRTVAIICALFSLTTEICALILMWGDRGEYAVGSNLLPWASLVLCLMAASFIKRDQKLLSSYDRLR